MADSYGQFTLWVSVYHLLKSEPSCTSHKPRASYQRWLVRGDLEHEISPYAATQSYTMYLLLYLSTLQNQMQIRWQDTSSQLLLSAFCSGPKLSSLQDIHFITKILLSSDKYCKHFQKSVDINFPNVYKVKLVYKLIQFANAVHFRSTIRMHPSFGTFHFIINIAL